jgi:hypothetical protein
MPGLNDIDSIRRAQQTPRLLRKQQPGTLCRPDRPQSAKSGHTKAFGCAELHENFF